MHYFRWSDIISRAWNMVAQPQKKPIWPILWSFKTFKEIFMVYNRHVDSFSVSVIEIHPND